MIPLQLGYRSWFAISEELGAPAHRLFYLEHSRHPDLQHRLHCFVGFVRDPLLESPGIFQLHPCHDSLHAAYAIPDRLTEGCSPCHDNGEIEGHTSIHRNSLHRTWKTCQAFPGFWHWLRVHLDPLKRMSRDVAPRLLRPGCRSSIEHSSFRRPPPCARVGLQWKYRLVRDLGPPSPKTAGNVLRGVIENSFRFHSHHRCQRHDVYRLLSLMRLHGYMAVVETEREVSSSDSRGNFRVSDWLLDDVREREQEKR